MQETEKTQFYPWVGKIPWRRAWQPTPVFLFGESCGQGNLAGHSPWGCRVGHNLATEHPVSCIQPGPATCFAYDNIHVSMLPSQTIPPLPSPTESKRLFFTSVSLLLSRTQGYCYHLSKFHIYVLVYCIGVFLSGLFHSV